MNPYEDVFFDISCLNISDIDVPEKYEKLKKILPHKVLAAIEGVEREGYVEAANREARRCLEESLEKIEVVGEYIGFNSRGEEVYVACPARVISAKIEEDELVLEIENPEHLVNDIINGVGGIYAHKILVDQVNEEVLLDRLDWITEYFSVYGDRYSTMSDRIEPVVSNQDLLESYLESELEVIEEDEIADGLFEYADCPEDFNGWGFDAEKLKKKVSDLIGEQKALLDKRIGNLGALQGNTDNSE